MPASTTAEELRIGRGGGGLPPAQDGGDGGRGDGDSGMAHAVPLRAYYLGLSLGLVSILMFFMALTSAYLVRKGQGDWLAFQMPQILWATTAVLIISSLTVERARKLLNAGSREGFRVWWGVTTMLGLLFLAGQLMAWQQLRAAGVFLSGNPSSSFFYVLSGAHGVHVIGGVLALVVVFFRRHYRRVTQAAAVEMAAIYWHFMDLLWVFLLLLLFLGR
ncbi:MAG: cytochrome c oxidase subunit 3 [Candidatus Acidiferrales bacterium]